MKASAIQVFWVLLVTAMPSMAQRFPTNSIDSAQAIKLASRLRLGMREQEIAKVLDEQSGLKFGGKVGDRIGWTRFYLLADGCSLHLQMDPKEVLPMSFKFEGTNIAGVSNMWGGNGLLRSAYLQSNGTRIASITLTNAPQPGAPPNATLPHR
jgi:hypothetical protein